MQITFVKKIKADGTRCRKCIEVDKQLRDAGLMDRIDRVVVADERDADSEGMLLAAKYKMEQAPFFIVEDDSESVRLYTVYFRFVKEILNRTVSEQEVIAELIDQNPDLDYI